MNLRPAPFALTPGTVAAALGERPARGVVQVPIETTMLVDQASPAEPEDWPDAPLPEELEDDWVSRMRSDVEANREQRRNRWRDAEQAKRGETPYGR